MKIFVAKNLPAWPVRLNGVTPGRFTAALLAPIVGLLVDVHGGVYGQLAVGVAVWGLMIWLIHNSAPGWRLAFWVCLIWSTAGEVFLSLVWGLYTYRLGNIPFFIPPGHVLLLYLGMVLAPGLPRGVEFLVPACAVVYAAVAWIMHLDTLSAALTLLFLLGMMQKEGRRLYAVMFVLSLLLELYGTWLGNWVWHREVPYTAFVSTNPPAAAGAFYCMLDVLVVLTVRGLARRAGVGAVPNST